MSRKNIFELINENYNVQEEIKKIERLFNNYKYFYSGRNEFSLKGVITNFLFTKWKYRGTCLTIEEYEDKADAKIFTDIRFFNNESNIINKIELLENLIYLYYQNSEILKNKYYFKEDDDFSDVFLNLINTLEKRMGLITKNHDELIVVYKEDAALEQVLKECTNENLQWELIRYVREDLTLAEKRKSLAYFATEMYIEQDKNEENEIIKNILHEATNILNNVHIRHNNIIGKWECDALKQITEEEAIELCDLLFNKILIIDILRKQKKYEPTYQKFNTLQKK